MTEPEKLPIAFTVSRQPTWEEQRDADQLEYNALWEAKEQAEKDWSK